MKKTSIKYFAFALAFVGFSAFFAPANASAATVFLESSRATVAVGDTVIISVKINADGTTINTVDGNVAFTSGGNDVTIREYSLANSAFGLWPRTPSLSKDGLSVSFVGGVPGGFNIEGATMFKIILQATKPGSVTIAPQNIIAYANDGNGTKLPVQLKNVVINITAKKAGTAVNDEWGSLVASDTIPPQDFIVVAGQDKTLFDGKKFVFFSAVDNETGIAYYDVSENGAPAVKTGSTYVLQNQAGDVKLVVTAYDKAGNKKTATYSSVTPSTLSMYLNGVSWSTVLIVVLVIVIGWLLYVNMKKSKKDVEPAKS